MYSLASKSSYTFSFTFATFSSLLHQVAPLDHQGSASPCSGFPVHLMLFSSLAKCRCHVFICEEHKAAQTCSIYNVFCMTLAIHKWELIMRIVITLSHKKNTIPAHLLHTYCARFILHFIYSRRRSCFLKCGRVSISRPHSSAGVASRRGLRHEAHEERNFPVCTTTKSPFSAVTTTFTWWQRQYHIHQMSVTQLNGGGGKTIMSRRSKLCLLIAQLLGWLLMDIIFPRCLPGLRVKRHLFEMSACVILPLN